MVTEIQHHIIMSLKLLPLAKNRAQCHTYPNHNIRTLHVHHHHKPQLLLHVVLEQTVYYVDTDSLSERVLALTLTGLLRCTALST